jgi:hypothetical protein
MSFVETSHSDREGCLVLCVGEVGRGSFVDEQLDDVQVFLHCGAHQGRSAVFVLMINVGSFVDEHLADLKVPFSGSTRERRDKRVVDRVGVCFVIKKKSNKIFVFSLDGGHESSPSVDVNVVDVDAFLEEHLAGFDVVVHGSLEESCSIGRI